jgi:hypothetical protein
MKPHVKASKDPARTESVRASLPEIPPGNLSGKKVPKNIRKNQLAFASRSPTSFQLMTFQNAFTYSARRFWYLR